ncbi:MAG: hypothetical protein HW378_3120 [Anaerolineales bacterium]|nr:hypothetical protein [Anaerolineales bacterium]
MSLFIRHLRALALLPVPASSLPFSLSLLAAHLLALALVCRLAHWPLWLAPFLLAAFCLPQLILRRWLIESLAPLITVYLLAILRLFIIYGLRQEIPPVLDYAGGFGLSAAWTGLIFLGAIRRLRYAWITFAAGTAALMANVVWLNRPAGVTGSDPFAYVQMGLDLAQHGTPLHRFPLAPFAESLGLSPLPTTHVGYVLPNALGLAPTVWPPGYSVLLALAYRLGGEGGMLLLNTWLGLLSLALTAALTVLICPSRWRRLSLPIGMVAAFVVATSFEQFTALAVPMADVAAQLFTALAVVLALYAVRVAPTPGPREAPLKRSGRGSPIRYPFASLGVLRESNRQGRGVFPPLFAFFANGAQAGPGWGSGLALAAAYSVRYTQVLAAPGIALIAWLGLKNARHRYSFLAAFAIAALAGAAPDVWYRTRLYGAPWRFGSGELALFSFGALPEALNRLRGELFSSLELGWLWPLLLVGAIYLWRRRRLALIGLAAAYGPLIAFHIWYPFLKLRDLLSLYPPLAALIAMGGAVVILTVWQRALRPFGIAQDAVPLREAPPWGWVRLAVRVLILAGLCALILLRLSALWGLREGGFFTFGYLYPEQRRSLESIATLTEPDAVIACSLNSGAVELYGERETVRPGRILQPGTSWGTDQWLAFAAALRAEGRPLYVLMDSIEMDEPLAALQDHYTLTRVADLAVPVYYRGGGSRNLTVPMYRVEP